MGYWHTRGLRGSSLEDLINFTNDIYRQRGLALLQKIPTPITPIEVDNKKHVITLAYFEQQSTVDYMGVVQGIPVCFDAKEIKAQSLPIQNIHPHQIQFMKDFQKQRGIAFLLVHFSQKHTFHFLPFPILEKYWTAAQSGGRKSIPYTAFAENYMIAQKGGVLEYLDTINRYLEEYEGE